MFVLNRFPATQSFVTSSLIPADTRAIAVVLNLGCEPTPVKANACLQEWVGTEENKKYANINASKFTLYYGGITAGTAKRIDMKFSNSYFDFKLNIRNKQGGIAPTHFLLDYTSKEGTGKKLLG